MTLVGEIKKDYEIGKGNKHDNLIWLACFDCGFERWVKVSDTRKPKYQGVCHSCSLKRRNGKLNKAPQWKGGVKHCGERIYIFVPPESQYRSMSDSLGYVLEHRLVMAQHLGRCLSTEETVHHIDENKSNNKIENLMLFPTSAEHVSFHRNKEIKTNGIRPVDKKGRYQKGGYYAYSGT